MKLPSIFKTASHTRFDIKPRYYDPVKEDIDQRTSWIQKELESKGVLNPEEYGDKSFGKSNGSSIRGAFTQGSLRKSSTSGISSAGLLRMIIFVVLMLGVFGYLYLGTDALYYILYFLGGVFAVRMLMRLKAKPEDE